MQYFVILPNGTRYGPADLATLCQWASEGRLIPASRLEEAATRRQLSAYEVPGLVFPQAGTMGAPGARSAGPQVPGPQGGFGSTPFAQAPLSGYQRPQPVQYAPSSAGVTTAWILGSAGLLLLVTVCCCPLLAIVSVGLAIGGLVLSNKAKNEGNPQAQAPWVYNLVVLILSALVFIASLVLTATMMSGPPGF